MTALPVPEFVQNFELGAKDFVTAGNAAAKIKIALKQLGVDSKILRRTAIAAYEAEINITAHSNGGRIISSYYPDCVLLVFDDDGPGMEDIEQSISPGYSTADDQVREMGFGAGMGLPNIKKNCDILHIVSEKDKSTFLEMLIYFR
jgi:serine/threonine-protein kinase RsbT